jgi:hypothetical protein
MAIRPRVYTARDAACDAATSEDSYLTKVVKYIPAEIVAAYVAAARALARATRWIWRPRFGWWAPCSWC